MLSRTRFFLLITAIITCFSCNGNKVRRIPIIDFFKTPERSVYKISPDGKYVSYLKPYKDKQNIFIQSLADGKEHMATSFADYSVRGDYFWTYANQLVFSQDLIATDSVKMYALDVASNRMHTILSLGNVRIGLVNRNRQQPDIITIKTNERDPANFDVYRLNIKTGEMKTYLLNPGNITEWFADADGRIRLERASDGVNETILFRPDEDAPFKPIIENNFKNTVRPIAFTGIKNYFYALSNVNRDKTALVEINAEDGKEVRTIFDCAKADITWVDYSKNKRRIELAGWDEAMPRKHFLAPDMEQVYNIIQQQLKGNQIRVVDRDSSENKFIVNTYTDRNPGSYYLYEKSTGKLNKLGDVNSSLLPNELCEMKPISFKARDGLLINGYLTLPLGNKKDDYPVVVMPHDGPWGRDLWGYDEQVQFLANRGYAVFQVNYRGSTGYGKAFRSAGYKQVGGKIQDDITDGVHWLIDTKIANPKKIAIFGGRFGGFSALYGVSFHPELYNCAVVQYGLINFFTYIKDAPPFVKPYLKMVYEMVGNPETDADQLRAISPVFHTDKIKVPLIIFQGAKDQRANISELNQFVRELRKRNVDVKYFLKPNERAYFRSEHNRMEMYTEIEKFLDKNMRVKP
ncbi:dipeptidyl aminopeptidase/acylaminoacyl peptidase [Mucilaginibacter oryzae]|uniref:Dipeptidyl aminopeptidase/acylaminoacyl peptidase n=1 Tax=Mucilaginibacter oryzae TaxID=468058 RepID=A0A316H7R7_9SPHI|nr:prolyl oligopeptidase family serine peptidase [Mucilaginibacter oryzae]PWK76437.1 dipeptidyl aminopeptidase/acylaminoacyl peptidase [Mucilaginibacter oryzae]